MSAVLHRLEEGGRAERGEISYDLGEGVLWNPGKLLPESMPANGLHELRQQPFLKGSKAHPHFEAYVSGEVSFPLPSLGSTQLAL